MKKNVVLLALCSFLTVVGYSQIKVVAPNGDTGIGVDAPTEKLEVAGSIQIQNNNHIYSRLNDNTKHSVFRLNGGNQIIINADALNNNAGHDVGAFFITGDNTFFAVNNADNGPMIRAIESSGNVAIGFSGASDKLRVNGAVSATAFNISSDKRLKKNVTKYKKGLDAVLNLEPITFKYNDSADLADDDFHIGLFAQNLQEVAPEMVSEFMTYTNEEINRGTTREDQSYLQIKDNEVKYLLINAIKEQQKILEALQIEVNELQKQVANNNISEQEGGSYDIIELSNSNTSFISQNRPNPFANSTIIDYSIRKSAKSADILFFDQSGKLINTTQLDISAKKVEIQASDLQAGIYSYQLRVDSELIATKSMVISK